MRTRRRARPACHCHSRISVPEALETQSVGHPLGTRSGQAWTRHRILYRLGSQVAELESQRRSYGGCDPSTSTAIFWYRQRQNLRPDCSGCGPSPSPRQRRFSDSSWSLVHNALIAFMKVRSPADSSGFPHSRLGSTYARTSVEATADNGRPVIEILARTAEARSTVMYGAPVPR